MPKFLCLTSHDLDGPAYGATLRAKNIFRLLSRFGEVRVVLADPSEVVDENVRRTNGGFELLDVVRFQNTQKRSLTDRLRHELDWRFVNADWAHVSTEERERLKKHMASHDLVWIHGLKLANGFGLWRWPKTVLDIDDIPSSFHRSDLAQTSGVINKLRCHRQVFLWERREKKIVERFDAVCVCSDADRQKLGGSGKIFVVPNGFDAPATPPVRRPSVPPRIGFVGTFKYRPNSDGVSWFINQVWPQILLSMPQARLRLIGAGSENLSCPKDKNIDQLGFVQDTEAEMASWSLSIVPVFIGGGTRIKIAEAFSRKCPIVSTTLGAYGYGAVDGRELFLADSAAEFGQKCLRILSDPSVGQTMAENGWQRFLESWTWESFASRIAKVVGTVLPDAQPSFKPDMAL